MVTESDRAAETIILSSDTNLQIIDLLATNRVLLSPETIESILSELKYSMSEIQNSINSLLMSGLIYQVDNVLFLSDRGYKSYQSIYDKYGSELDKVRSEQSG